MKFAKLVLALALLPFGMAVTAEADGMARRPAREAVQDPVAPARSGWDGFYFGAGLGANFTNSHHDYFITLADPTKETQHKTNFMGYVVLGFDKVVHPGFLVGVFGDYDFGHTKISDMTKDSVLGPCCSKPYSLAFDNSWAVGARAGAILHDHLLLFVEGGYTGTNVKYKINDISLVDDAVHGFFIGVGGDMKLHNNLFLQAKYRFSDYAKVEKLVDRFCNCDEHDRFQHDVHSIRFGLAYKFGAREEVYTPLK